MGIWRRIRLIPFTVTIPEDKKDKRLAEKLKGEMPGILNWAIAGCLRWQSEGLIVPSCVKNATDEYRAAEDIIGQFISEATAAHGETAKGDLYQHYVTWADKAGMRYKLTARKFNERVTERGDIEDGRTNTGRIWRGISPVALW